MSRSCARAWVVTRGGAIAAVAVACGGEATPGRASPNRPTGDDADAAVVTSLPVRPLDAGHSPWAPACTLDPAFHPGAPFTTPAGAWTFVSVPESLCMDGTSTGIVVDARPDSKKLLLYFEGGGACFDAVTCLAAAHANGFGEAQVAEVAKKAKSGILDRSDPENPYRDWSFVFVPYCSGDVHAGNTMSSPTGKVHVGFANVRHDLERIVPSFPAVERVVVAGSSAGGFGAAYDFDQVARAFACAHVDLVDDAGIPMGDDFLRPCLQSLWRDVWRLDTTIPADCADCGAGTKGGISRFMPYLARKYPTSRFAYLSSTEDATIRTFFGYGYSDHCDTFGSMDGPTFQAGLLDVRDRILAGLPNAAVYAVGGWKALQHTFLLAPLGKTETAGAPLSRWLGALDTGAASWASAGP